MVQVVKMMFLPIFGLSLKWTLTMDYHVVDGEESAPPLAEDVVYPLDDVTG